MLELKEVTHSQSLHDGLEKNGYKQNVTISQPTQMEDCGVGKLDHNLERNRRVKK